MIKGRGGSVKKDPKLITGDEQEYAEITNIINQFRPNDLQNNHRFLMQKLVKKQGYFRNRYEKKDFATLSKVMNTHFAVFKNLLGENKALQNNYNETEEALLSKKELIRKLTKQKADLQSQNERLKSRILSVHEQNLAKYESQKTSVVNIVVEDESMRFVGKVPSERVIKLEEKEDKYEGYKESDLPVFRRVDQLISYVEEESVRYYDFPSNSSVSFQSQTFGEEIKPEPVDLQVIKKYMKPPQMSKEIHSNIEVESEEISALKLGSVFQSRIRSTSMKEPKLKPTESFQFQAPDDIRKTEKKMIKLGSNQLQSKYVPESNHMLNCQVEPLTKQEAYHKIQANRLNQMRKEIFKNKFRKG